MTPFARQYPSEAEAERAYRRRWILIPGVVVLLCVVVGLVYAVGPSRTREDRIDQTYPAGITKIEVTGPGDVSVTGAPVSRIQATWQTHWNYRKPAVRSTRDGDTLKLRLDCSESVGVECWADLRLGVPKGVGLVASARGDGDVNAYGVDGPVTVNGTSGDVRVADVTGDVDLRDTSGDIRLARVEGKVTAQSDSGDVMASELTGKTARLNSTSGDVRGEFGAAPGHVTAESTSGDVTVGLPPGTGPYRVRAGSSSGDVRTEVSTDPSAASIVDATSVSGDVKVAYLDDDGGDRHDHHHDHDHMHEAPMPRRPMPPQPGRPG